jgi:mRNA-degrading endonuclease toxin of MazEF toxin-antitoxin module
MYKNSMGLITAAICTFREAFLHTDDKRFSDAGIVLLNRVADFYPELDACVYKWEDNFRHSGGAWGKIIGSIWEGYIVDNLTKAYDAFFPAIDQNTVDEIKKRIFYRDNPLTPLTPKDIKLNIENNLLRQILPEVKNHRIRGNVGMHQSSVAVAALVLQNDVGNRYAATTIVAAITACLKEMPTLVDVEPSAKNGLQRPCAVNLSHIRTVSKSRLVARVGQIEEEHLPLIEQAILISLGFR